jgi:hypothetical protein
MLVESRIVGKSWWGISWIPESKGVWWMKWGKITIVRSGGESVSGLSCDSCRKKLLRVRWKGNFAMMHMEMGSSRGSTVGSYNRSILFPALLTAFLIIHIT